MRWLLCDQLKSDWIIIVFALQILGIFREANRVIAIFFEGTTNVINNNIILCTI